MYDSALSGILNHILQLKQKNKVHTLILTPHIVMTSLQIIEMVNQYRKIVNKGDSEGDDVCFTKDEREKAWKIEAQERNKIIPSHDSGGTE